MKKLLFLLCIFCFVSCIPNSTKEEIRKGLSKSMEMMVQSQFTTAINYIEVHKIRYGAYPDRLSSLTHISPMDAGFSTYVDYQRLDSGYQLNSKVNSKFEAQGTPAAPSKLPDDFWKGLGCRKSNLMTAKAALSLQNNPTTPENSQPDSTSLN